MADMEQERLRVGHTFPDIDILKLRVAEEANLRGITFFTPSSKVRQLRCYGKKFAVEANNTEHTEGFLVSVCSIWEGDDFATLNLDKYNNAKEREQMLFKTVIIVPLIIRIVAENPAVTNKTLHGYLKSYGRDYALTESVLNKARCSAPVELFQLECTEQGRSTQEEQTEEVSVGEGDKTKTTKATSTLNQVLPILPQIQSFLKRLLGA
jgi:hypothetical protein